MILYESVKQIIGKESLNIHRKLLHCTSQWISERLAIWTKNGQDLNDDNLDLASGDPAGHNNADHASRDFATGSNKRTRKGDTGGKGDGSNDWNNNDWNDWSSTNTWNSWNSNNEWHSSSSNNDWNSNSDWNSTKGKKKGGKGKKWSKILILFFSSSHK